MFYYFTGLNTCKSLSIPSPTYTLPEEKYTAIPPGFEIISMPNLDFRIE